MLVSHQRVGLWWDAELTEEIGQCDIRGFIPVDDLQRLPELDALICVSLRNDLLSFPYRTGNWCPSAWWRNWLSPRYAISLLATLLARQLEAQKLDPLALKAIGSVTLKKGAGAYSARLLLPRAFKTFTAEALREFEHHFPGSGFVRKRWALAAYPARLRGY